MQIEGVPETIKRSAFMAMVRSAGLNPDDLRAFSASTKGITAEVFARGADGELLVEDDHLATHHLFVRFEEA